MIEIIEGLLYVFLIVSALLLIVVILLQEGKGGGLASAFGGMGGEAFGVGAGGVNKVTAVLAGLFIGSAAILAALPTSVVQEPEDEPAETAPENPGNDNGNAADQPGNAGDEAGNE